MSSPTNKKEKKKPAKLQMFEIGLLLNNGVTHNIIYTSLHLGTEGLKLLQMPITAIKNKTDQKKRLTL